MPNITKQLLDLERLYPHSLRVFALDQLTINSLVSRDKTIMWLISISAGISCGIISTIRHSEFIPPTIFIWICFVSSLIFLSLLALEVSVSFGRKSKLEKQIKQHSSLPNYAEQALNDISNRYWNACSTGSLFNRIRWASSWLPIIGRMLKADLRTQCLYVLSGGDSDRFRIKDTISLSFTDTGQVGYKNLVSNSTQSERLAIYKNILSNASESRLTKKQVNIVHAIIISLNEDCEEKGKNKSDCIKRRLDHNVPKNGITIETIHKYILANTHSSLDLILHRSSSDF